MAKMLRKSASETCYECPVCAKKARRGPSKRKANKRDRHIARAIEKRQWKAEVA